MDRGGVRALTSTATADVGSGPAKAGRHHTTDSSWTLLFWSG